MIEYKYRVFHLFDVNGIEYLHDFITLQEAISYCKENEEFYDGSLGVELVKCAGFSKTGD